MYERWSEGGIPGARGQDPQRDWLARSKDSSLLDYAQKNFDVLVTIDRKLERQHNLKTLKLGFVIARAPSNEIGSYHPIFAALRQAAESVKRGDVSHVVSPQMRDVR